MKRELIVLGMMSGLLSAEVEISVAGIRVSREAYKSRGEDKSGTRELNAFGHSSGTEVALLIKDSEKTIIRLESKSDISVFTDDQGNDLRKIDSRFGRDSLIGSFHQRSADGKALMATVETKVTPAKGSQQVILRGKMLVTVASKTQELTSETVGVEVGQKMVVGQVPFKIEKMGQPDWGDKPFSITLKSSVSSEDFKKFTFLDAEGEELEVRRLGSGWTEIGDSKSHTVTFGFDEKIEKVSLKVQAWTDLETEEVPVEFMVGLGL